MADQSKLQRLLSRKVFMGATVGAALLFMVVGIIFWGGFNTAMEATNTLEFCISCHEMEENVYQEYKTTIHYSNRSGVRAICSDCHVPDPWVHKMVRKIKASNEIFHKIMGTVNTPEKFQEHRLTMAKREWKRMKETDSRECRNCHDFATMNPANQKKRSRKQHMFAMEQGLTCIDCHKGIAHKNIHQELTDEEREALEKPNPEFKRELPPQWVAFVEAQEEKERQEREAAAKRRAEMAAKAAAQAEKQAEAGGANGGAGEPDWATVPAREVTLFYPGQTSMEWTLEGSDHGGARVFRKAGDRCFDCHEGEEEAMGTKMVNGEKAETTPIPGKRPGIPVTVQAAHDGENLYMRFQWPDTEHVPVPFADGGKMDPDNKVKLALMLANDEVKYASQAGCWQTCHHDASSMPHAPDGTHVTKYLEESRTAISVEDEPRGGWDKRKDDAAIEAELAANHFMDVLRYKAGTDETENGHILGDREMDDPNDGVVSFSGGLEDGTWTVTMKRKLKPGQAGDLDLDPAQVYNIGFAIHDDFANARYHHVSLGFKLGFDNPDAEINAVERTVSGGSSAAAPAGKPAAKAAAGGGASSINWGLASSREVTLFYPGQTSMEWALEGSDHGGARVFRKAGDRCFDCHEGEEEAMGTKMVNGEKAETTPIPGKRPGIPVTVQAAHDGEKLYLRFQWPDTEHVPVPFADGGKMDPENPVKLALMLASDEVEYASQAGCWQTCHHDAKTMPHSPDGTEVTKYLGESRTAISVEDEPRGGWDKRKDEPAIKAEMVAGHFMDLLRYNAGTGKTENGHILGDREMEDPTDGIVSFSGGLEDGTWTVTMERKLKPGQEGDLDLDPGQVYNIGFAIHDDFADARYHHVSLGFKLGFDNPDAEINAISQ